MLKSCIWIKLLLEIVEMVVVVVGMEVIIIIIIMVWWRDYVYMPRLEWSWVEVVVVGKWMITMMEEEVEKKSKMNL